LKTLEIQGRQTSAEQRKKPFFGIGPVELKKMKSLLTVCLERDIFTTRSPRLFTVIKPARLCKRDVLFVEKQVKQPNRKTSVYEYE